MAGSLTSQTIEITLGTIDVVKQTLGSWVNLGSVSVGTVGTAGTVLATFGEEINAKQMVLVPRGDQYDNGVAWSELQTVYQYGSEGVWDTDTGRSCSVVGTGTGYFMFQGAKGTEYQIVVMESDDGIVWGTGRRALPFGGEGSWDTQCVRMPSVLIDGGTTWKMWMAAQDTPGTYRIMYSTSADGLDWTVPAQAINIGSLAAYDYLYVTSPSVIRDGDHFKMLYNAVGGGGGGGSYLLAYATSEDGVTWSRGTPIMGVGTKADIPHCGVSRSNPDLVKDGTIYKVWYDSLYEAPTGSISIEALFYATSADCITWGSSVLSYAGTANGDVYALKEPSVITNPTGHQLWVAAYTGGTTYYATSFGTPENRIVLQDIWGGTVLTTIGTSITFRPSIDAPFVGPAYYFDNFGPRVKIGIINLATETLLDNIYVDVYAR